MLEALQRIKIWLKNAFGFRFDTSLLNLICHVL